MAVKDLIPVDYANQRVLTYKQIAQGLNCSIDLLRMHFKNHPEQFQEGVHYFKLEGETLRAFRRKINEVYSPNQQLVGKFASCLLIFTYQGVARLSKLIDTKEAWDELEKNYFNASPAETIAYPVPVEVIGNVRCYLDKDGVAWLNAEDVARGLGFAQIKNGVEYVRWETINKYLNDFGYNSFSQLVGKDDFIPENIFYLLAMKANNAAAKAFQLKIANEILPSLRKYGYYSVAEPPQENSRAVAQQKDAHAYVFDMSDDTVKIGITSDVEDRKKRMKRERGLEVRQEHHSPKMPRPTAQRVEKTLHRKFAHAKIDGEFFKADYPEVCTALDKVVGEEIITITESAELTPLVQKA